MSVIVVDYGMGNLHSIYKKLTKLTFDVKVSSDSDTILKAGKIILPGVGNFGAAIKNLKEERLYEILTWKILNDKTPTLGICLGMQLLSTFSEEGDSLGLGVVSARTTRFRIPDGKKLKVPHVGWNSVSVPGNSILMKNISEDSLFYFVHSYHFTDNKPEYLAGYTNYGYSFISLIENGNIFGTQFHPEKSHEAGMQLLKNFVSL
jgi:glutamine amidotransferase